MNKVAFFSGRSLTLCSVDCLRWDQMQLRRFVRVDWESDDYWLAYRTVIGINDMIVSQIWLVLYTCLSELCVDSRPAVRFVYFLFFRGNQKLIPHCCKLFNLQFWSCLIVNWSDCSKSACQTLLQTVAAHGHALRVPTWSHMVWKVR